MVFSWQEYWSGLPCPTPIDHTLWECFTMICHLSWPCMAWLIAPLSYTSPLAMTRLWPMKGSQCFWIVVLKKTLESPLDCKEIKPVHPKGNQSWILIGRTDTKAEAPILWPPDVKGRLIGKDPDILKDWGQEKKGETEDEMIEWDHRLNGHEFEQALGGGEGQESLACCSSWGHRVRHNLATEQWALT